MLPHILFHYVQHEYVCSHKCPKHCEGMEKEALCEEEAFLLVSFVSMEVVILCFVKNEMNNPIRKCVE